MILKNLFLTFLICSLLYIVGMWFNFAFYVLGGGIFDYRTSGDFWMRTTFSGFFDGFGKVITSLESHKFIYHHFIIRTSSTTAMLMLIGLFAAAYSIYVGLSVVKRRKLIILGGCLWLAIMFLGFYLVT